MNTPSTLRKKAFVISTVLYLGMSGLIPSAWAQADTNQRSDRALFTVVQQPPEFPGGMRAQQAYVQTKVRQIKDSTGLRLKGRVLVSFVVNEQGAIETVQAQNRRESEEAAQAVRLVQQMPAWKAGRQAGHAVAVKYNMTVNF